MPGNQLYTHVSTRLVEWGAYRRSAQHVGPKRPQSWWWPIVMRGNVQHINQNFDKEEYDEERALETEKAVLALEDTLQRTIFEHYVARGTIDQQINALGCVKSTLYERLDRAHAALIGYMLDVAAGLDPHD